MPENGAGDPAKQILDTDEPEAVVLLVACGVGLVTGAGVVAFNDAILWIKDIAFLQAPVETVHWGIWARQLSLRSSLLVTLLPPLMGGITVGLFRLVSGGFADPPPLSNQERARQQGASASQSVLQSIKELGSQASGRLRGRQAGAADLTEAGQGGMEKGGGGASNSDPGSRDFAISDRGEAAEAEQERQAGQGGAQLEASSSGKDHISAGAAALRRQARAAIAPVLRATAAAITLGSGCSLGPEGPSVEIGRSTARALGRLLRSKQRRLIPLLAAGSGAGVAAGFNAPVSGVFFAVESVLNREPRNSETEKRNSSGLTVGMVLLASVAAAIVSRAGLGDTPAFRVPPYQLQSILEIPLVMLLGSTCGVVSVAFSYCSEVSSKAFKRLNPDGAASPLVWVMMPALGGLCTGTVALAFPEILYQGFANVNALLELRTEDYAPPLLLQMLGAKVLVTAVCRGSGLVGGIYAPSIFMGVALGSAFGGLAQAALIPTGFAVAAPPAYALVGVAAMLAANCQVPLTAVLLLFELTHDYFIIIPTLAAVGISYWTASLPIAAGISARLRAAATAEVGAGSVASVDGDDIVLGAPLLPRLRILGFLGRQKADEQEQAKVAIFKEGSAEVSAEPAKGSFEAKEAPLSLPLSSSLESRTAEREGMAQRNGSAAVANGSSLSEPQTKAAEVVADMVQELTAGNVCSDDEEACVMIERDTPLSEALLLLDSVGQTAALVLDDSQMVTGVLTRDRILAALEAEAQRRLGRAGADSDDDNEITVEMVGAKQVTRRRKTKEGE